MTEVRVPELGENVPGGDVTRVLVKVGDTIAREQAVLELETDKATIEVPSSVAGRISQISVSEGDKVTVGALILTVDDEEAQADAPADAPVEATSDIDGPARIAAQPGGNVVAMPVRDEASSSARISARQAPLAGPSAPASPSVRRLARELGVNINHVHGSGGGGRISEEDVKEYARRLVTSAGTGGGASARAASLLPDFERWGEIDRQPMSNIRRTTSERLGHAWDVIPHVTQFDKADITAMEALRTKYRGQVRDAGGNLTVTAMLVKVMATAVKQFPQLNASLDTEAQEIIYKK